ncbi:MAG: selenocysteine lyase [Euryarchaeota archaeon RBG_19FT_COMBO_56_21]|nr:MAG: selenocysteine lyase [Euryarchaeota archaeon RBG_19FT_COMBO_56_21]
MDVSKIRKDFAVLNKEIGGRVPIYFDNACQTLRPRQVTEAVMEYYESYPACAGRSVHKLATEVSLRCDAVRARAAEYFNAENPMEIAFTKNATEGLNTVIFGSGLTKGDEVVTTDYEHNSVHVPVLELVRTSGVRHRIVRSAKDGTFDIEAFEKIMTRKVKLVAMCFTSNVTGYTLPAREVIDIAHSYGAKVLLDAAQAAPSRKIDVRALGVDFLAASAHKMCGPSGVGLLYVKGELGEAITPRIFGGHGVTDTDVASFTLLPPPERFETGLQNYSGIVGTGAALQYISSIGLDEILDHEISLNKRISHALADTDAVSIVGPSDPNLRGGLFSFNVKKLSAHDVAMILDNSKNIMMRSGMHCCHTFFHMRRLDGCARVSVYIYNTKDEVDIFTEAVKDLANKFSSGS